MSSETLHTGRVKWFNNKAGYGFISITDGKESGRDVFVHHSSIVVSSEQYKYLVQGEYVSFSLVPTKDSEHEFQAERVSGINGGKLMCETRRESRTARMQYRDEMDGEECGEWTKVAKTEKTQGQQKTRPPKTSQPKTPSQPKTTSQPKTPSQPKEQDTPRPPAKKGRPRKNA